MKECMRKWLKKKFFIHTFRLLTKEPLEVLKKLLSPDFVHK